MNVSGLVKTAVLAGHGPLDSATVRCVVAVAAAGESAFIDREFDEMTRVDRYRASSVSECGPVGASVPVNVPVWGLIRETVHCA